MYTLRNSPKKHTGVAHQASSESDISTLNLEKPLTNLVRSLKRPRNDNKGNSDDGSLRNDLLDMLSSWKKDQDIIFNKLCVDIAELKLQNTSIIATNDEMEKSLKFISLQYDDMKTRLLDLERERKLHINIITSLENNLENIQKRLKFTAIEVRNLPQQIKAETQQDLCDVVENICTSVNVSIQRSDIKDIYKITNSKGASTIVTDFTSTLTKSKVMDGIKEFNRKNGNSKLSSSTIGLRGRTIPIYISESLTSKDRILYALARDAAKTLAYKYCWHKWGKIFLKKSDGATRIEIKNESDLEALKKP